MKKLLTIVALALILCLGISALVAGGSAEIYKAHLLVPALGTDTSGNYPVYELSTIQDPSNWIITEGDYTPLPDSTKMGGGSKELSLLNILFVSEANAEYSAPAATVVVGAIVHGEPTIVTVTDVNGISAQAWVMILGNDHVAHNIEYAIQADGLCHSRYDCAVAGCNWHSDWSAKPDHDPKTIATKVEDGKKILYCTVCGGQVNKFDDGHNHAAKKVREWLEMPTCQNEQKGKFYYVCGECGVCLTYDGSEVADEYGDALIHTVTLAEFISFPENKEWKDLYNASNKYDGKGYYVDEGHLWGDYAVLKAADCMQAGYVTRTCYFCDAQMTVENKFDPAKGVYYAPVTVACNSTADIQLKCRYCNGTYGDTIDPKTGRSHVPAKFKLAGQTLATLAATYPADIFGNSAVKLQHTYDMTETPYTIPATCTKPGQKIWFCVYGDWDEDDHNQYWDSTDGLHEDFGEGTYVEYTQETGHAWSDWKVVVEPADNVRGIWSRKCENIIQYWYYGAKVTKACTGTEEHISWFAPCSDDTHEFELIEEESEPATCTEAGWNYYECYKCGYWYYEDIEALGHDVKDLKVLTPATCTATGVKVGKCARCNAYIEEEIPMAEHAWGEWAVKTPATLTTKGIEERKCANCDATEEREVEFKPAETSVYTVSEFVYDKEAQEVTGKVTLDPTTAAQKVVKARVSFYLADKSWFAVVTDVKADGTFSVGTNVNAVYVKVNIMGENATHHIPDEKDVYGTGEAKIVGE